MLRKFKLVFVALAIIVANQAVSFAVSAARPQGTLPPGTVRFSVVQAQTITSTSSLSWTDLALMTTPFSIPAGTTADVMVLFCGEVGSLQTVLARAVIGGVAAVPTYMKLWRTSQTSYESRCGMFYRTSVPAGSYSAKMQWEVVTTSANASMFGREMIVIVNVHS